MYLAIQNSNLEDQELVTLWPIDFNLDGEYGIKDPIYCIPSNYMFTDACNDGNVIDFIYNNLGADKMDYNGYFISETKEVLKEILNKVRI